MPRSDDLTIVVLSARAEFRSARPRAPGVATHCEEAVDGRDTQITHPRNGRCPSIRLITPKEH